MNLEQKAMQAATIAARRTIAKCKDDRTLLSTYSPTGQAFHIAWAAVDAYRNVIRAAGNGRR